MASMVQSLSGWFSELRTAARTVRRNARFSAFVVLILAMGFGGAVALFGLVEKVALTEVPVPHADRLVLITARDPKGDRQLLPLTFLRDLETHAEAFDHLSGYTGPMVFVATLPQGISNVGVETVTGDFFGMLGVAPQLGRVLTPADSDVSATAQPVPAVLGYRFWQRAFDGDVSIVGREFPFGTGTAVVVGVLPRRFTGIGVELEPDVFITQQAYAVLNGTSNPRVGARTNFVIARLKEGISLDSGAANLAAVFPGVQRRMMPPTATPAERDALGALSLRAESFRYGFSTFRDNYDGPLRALTWLVGALLALATANLMGLLIARGTSRRAELRVRLALGASNLRLARQFAAEAFVLLALGLAVALPLGVWLSRTLVAMLWTGVSRPELSLFPGPLTWAAIASAALLAFISLGLVPAAIVLRQARRPLSDQNRATRGARRGTAMLLVAQVALSLALVATASLFAKNLGQWYRSGLGFSTDRVTLLGLSQQPNGYKGIVIGPYYQDLIERIQTVPGVEAVGVSYFWATYSRTVGQPDEVFAAGTDDSSASAYLMYATPGFLDSISVPLRVGRDFDWGDDPSRPPVAIVSAGLAAAMAPDGNVIGRRVRVGADGDALEVVGVVNDFRLTDPRVPAPAFVIRPMAQLPRPIGLPSFTVRSGGPVPIDEIRRVVGNQGREYVLRAMSLADRVGTQMVRERLTTRLGAMLAGLSLLIVGIGLGSLLAVTVTARTREFGVRLALGASPRSLWSGVARDSVLLAGLGVALGLPLAGAAGRIVAAVLINVSPTDVTALSVAATVVLATALIAALAPARRAATTDPLTALRSE
ncbi:MAG: ABC transporter permease [Vicinamibacterales bacterium]